MQNIKKFINYLCCPVSKESLILQKNELISKKSSHTYRINKNGIPIFADKNCSKEAMIQRKHYNRIARIYIENLQYPHTQEYTNSMNKLLIKYAKTAKLNNVVEICCGYGEALKLFKNSIGKGVGIDISEAMLGKAVKDFSEQNIIFLQADGTALPLKNKKFDAVFMIGGIHHINNREKLFYEVARILKPGGHFFWREPVNDFFLWRMIREIVYRISPILDYETENPLRYDLTSLQLKKAGLTLKKWHTFGFLGFCFFMNSDILIFNKLFKFIPGIRIITRLMANFDALVLKLPGMKKAGLQVIGVATK